MRKSTSLKVSAATGVVLFAAACGSGTGVATGDDSGTNGEGEETIVLKGVTAWDQNAINSAGFFMLAEKVEELSEGRIRIEFVGGPEAIPPFEQAEAVRTGVVDISDLSTAYYAAQLPAAQALNYTELTPQEMRENGALDYLNELHHETLNAHILGKSLTGGYSIYASTPVTSTEELGNMMFRATPTYVPLVEALGAEHAQTPGAEIYSAVERGVVEAYVWPDHGVSDLGLHEVTACQVEPFFWQIDDVNLINLDTWESLPEWAREIMTEASIAVENEVEVRVEEFRAEEDALFEEVGMERCQLEDADRLLELASESPWDWVDSALPEDQASRLQDLFN